MVKVLLIDPALATLRDRFAERLPSDVEVAVVGDFGDEEFRRHAADATILVNARRPVDAATLAMAPATRLIQMIGAGVDPIDQRPRRPPASRSPSTPASTRPGPRSTRSC